MTTEWALAPDGAYTCTVRIPTRAGDAVGVASTGPQASSAALLAASETARADAVKQAKRAAWRARFGWFLRA